MKTSQVILPALQYHPLRFDGHGLNAPEGDRILNFSRHPQCNGGDYILSRETHEAIARPITAIPSLLKALASAYERACEAVARVELIRGPESPEVEPLYEDECAIRDEYRQALLEAGATFADDGGESPEPRTNQTLPHPNCPTTMKITRKDIDPRLSNAANARALGVDPSAITKARLRFKMQASPLTFRKVPDAQKARRAQIKLERSYAYRKEQQFKIDWRMCDLEISLIEGVSVAQVSRWRKEAAPKVKRYTKYDYVLRAMKANEWAAKISERRTVHEWLNAKGVPVLERNRPLCLLRRLAIALGISEHEDNGESVPAGTEPALV